MSSKNSGENLQDSSAPDSTARANYYCGRWRIDAEQRVLFLDEAPVPLAPRDFDLLAVLVANAGRVVSKDELLKRVWGPIIVEEGNLASHVSVLRGVLGQVDRTARCIETVPKRGYRFVAKVDAAPTPARAFDDAAAPIAATESVATELPPQSAASWSATHEAQATRRSWLTWRWGALAAVLLLTTFTALWWWRAASESALPFVQRDWLLVADFENHTGDARFDSALLTALTVSLEQSQFVNVFPRARMAATLDRMRQPVESRLTEELAREICSRENIRALVTASITRTGTQYALAARLVDPRSGTAVRSYLRQVQNESGLLTALQEIGNELRSDLGESLSSIAAADRPLAEVTTPVLDALRLYSDGQKHWNMARYGDAADDFRAAISADAEFAMAHAALGRAYYSNAFNRVDLGNEHFQRALALAERTTARERLAIDADFAASRRDAPRAIELYQRYAALYPDDPVIHQNLGHVYLEAGRLDDAVASLQLALQRDPANPKVLNNAAVTFATLDRFRDAIALFERAVEVDPDVLERHTHRFNYATILFAAGEHARARELMLAATRRETENDRAWRALGLYAQFEGHYRQAAEHFAKAIAAVNTESDAALSRSRNHGYLAAVLATRGESLAARRELDAAAASLDAHGEAPANFRARIAAKMARLGAVSQAKAQLDKLPVAAGADNSARLYVLGEIASARGDSREAIRLLERALAAAPDPSDQLLVRFALARVLEAAGDRDRAIDVYQKLASVPRGQWIGWEAQEPQQLAGLALARLYLARGDAQLARDALARIQADWRTADPDLPPARELGRLTAAAAIAARSAAPERLAAMQSHAPAPAAAPPN